MPNSEPRKVDTEEEIREIARHVASAAAKVGTTVELREEVGQLAVLVRELVDEVRPLSEALPDLARTEDVVNKGAFRRRVALTVGSLLLLMATLFASNRYALHEAREQTCAAINGNRGVLRDLIRNSAAANNGPIDPTLPENIQKIIRENRATSKKFNDQALLDLADNQC